MEFNPDDIRTLAETVWAATLGLSLQPGGTNSAGPRSTVASVQITGGWNGAVLVDCSTEVARRAAAVMFAAKPESVSVPDMQDAVAELANIIGGNIKALLPGQCFLSLPSVVEGADYSSRMPGSRVATSVELSCDGQRVAITILQRTGDDRARAAA